MLLSVFMHFEYIEETVAALYFSLELHMKPYLAFYVHIYSDDKGQFDFVILSLL